jgi:hypothetical protein
MNKMAKIDEMVDGGSADDALSEAEEQSSALAVYSQEVQFDAEDVYIPRLRLAQGLTKEVQDGTAKPGQFLITGFGPEEDVTLVPVGFTRTRQYRDPEDGSQMLCFSREGQTGEGDPGGECAQCPLSKWTEADGRRQKPACAFSYSYLFYSQNHDTITAFNFKGMAINAGKMLNTIVSHHGIGKIAVRLASETKQVRGNSFFVPSVSVAVDADEDLLETAQRAVAGA